MQENRRSADILVRQATCKELADKNVRAPALLALGSQLENKFDHCSAEN
jgi:hypothetical protein